MKVNKKLSNIIIAMLVLILASIKSFRFQKDTIPAILIPTNTPVISRQYPSKQSREQAEILKVIDGDTIEVRLNGVDERIRIIGIDTPETVDPRRPVECFGKEASKKATEIFATQSAVFLEIDPSQSDRDKYKRLLRFVFLSDGSDYGKIMIEDGYAFEYTYDIPYTYQVQYKDAEQKAESEKKGLWADNACLNL